MNRLVYNVVLSRYEINDREYQRGNHKLTIQRIWPHMVQKTKKNKTGQNTICVRHHYAHANTNNVNKT